MQYFTEDGLRISSNDSDDFYYRMAHAGDNEFDDNEFDDDESDGPTLADLLARYPGSPQHTRLAEGAAVVLDTIFPGWEWRIEKEQLNIEDPWNCVLGQLCNGDFGAGRDVLDNSDAWDRAAYGPIPTTDSHVFYYNHYLAGWLTAIDKRRASNPRA